ALKASPIVKNADKFTTLESLAEATQCASENPIDLVSQGKNMDRIISQIQQMKVVYEQREKLGKNYNSFWGRFFGYSAKEKLGAAEAILKVCSDQKTEIDNNLINAASQGELGQLYNEYKEAMKSMKETEKTEETTNSPKEPK
ncbi:hypothetical protein I6N29_25580, partial [Escherichia coli]|uniref:hypothetical protein n=1 Tax=Escherichia coli TaxID=562 RepID=UPI001EDEA8A8